MDSRPPFASGAQRLRLLYTLPLTGRESAILVIGSAADADAVFDRTAPHAKVDIVSPGSRVATSAFDVVALPGCLTDGGRQAVPSESPEQLLQAAYSALRPGGVVIGHLDHLLSAHAVRQALQGRGLDAWYRCRNLASAGRCGRILVRAGFAAPQCFYVEPRIAAPMAIVPVHPQAARSHFLRVIRRARGQYSLPGYVLRMALAGLRLGGALQPHLFFWARRPC